MTSVHSRDIHMIHVLVIHTHDFAVLNVNKADVGTMWLQK